MVVTNGTARNFEQLVSTSQSQAMALALSLFQSQAGRKKVTYLVQGPVLTRETGAYSTDSVATSRLGSSLSSGRADPESIETFTCTLIHRLRAGRELGQDRG